jgi:ankyrin repeat protein
MSGFTIHEAAQNGNRAMLLEWIQQGVSVDDKDKNGFTALDWSVRNGKDHHFV